MAKQFFKDLPDTSTPLNASRLNGLLDGDEALGNIVIDSISSKNFFNKTAVPASTNQTRVLYLAEGIRVVSTSNGTYPTARFTLLDLTNYAGKTFTLSANINPNTGEPRMAIGTCDIDGGNLNPIATVDATSSGRKSVSATIPSTITSTNQYLYVAFYVAHGNASTSGNYCTYSQIQVNIGTETTYTPYQDFYSTEYAKMKIISFSSTQGQVIDTGIATNRSFGGIAIVLGLSSNTIETFGRRWFDTTNQANFITSNSNMIKENTTTRTMTLTSQNTNGERVILFYN